MFGEAPPRKPRPTTIIKSDFPEDWFQNEDVIRAARKAKSDFYGRKRSAPPSEEEQERVRTANRFLRALDLRAKRPRGSGNSARRSAGPPIK